MTVTRIRQQDTFLDKQRDTLKEVLNATPSPRSLRALRAAMVLVEVAVEAVLERNKVDEQTVRSQDATILAQVRAADERARVAAEAKARKDAAEKDAAEKAEGENAAAAAPAGADVNKA